MTKMGRPTIDVKRDQRATVRFTQEEYDLLLEYADAHKISVTQAIRLAVFNQMLAEKK